jgi:hypothetical protein
MKKWEASQDDDLRSVLGFPSLPSLFLLFCVALSKKSAGAAKGWMEEAGGK